MYITLKESLAELPKKLRDIFVDVSTLYKITRVDVNINGEIMLNQAMNCTYSGPAAFENPTAEDWLKTWDRFVDHVIHTTDSVDISNTLVTKFQIGFDQEFSKRGIACKITFQFYVKQPKSVEE